MLETNIAFHACEVFRSYRRKIIVSELDSFLLLVKIKGEVALALPSYVHVPSPLQVQVKWPVPKS